MQNSQYPFMPVVKARSVIWPGSQKTMGELLDNGCLTIKDLQKGTAKRSQKIRDYINKGGIPRTLDETYEVRWPFDKRTGMPAPDQLYYACVIILKSLVDKEEKKYADNQST